LESGDTIRDAGIGIGAYTLEIKRLENNTKYYIRPYAINGYGVEYGTPDLSDSTNIGTGIVATSEPRKENIYASEAVTGGEIRDAGEGEIKRRGIYYSTEKDLDIAVKDSVESTDDTDTYSCRLTGLTPSTTYYIQAYVENTYDLFKGNIDSILTRDGMPHIGDIEISGTAGFTDITLTSTVTNGGDETVTIEEQGFCWALFPEQPTISNNTVKCDKDENGKFEETITGLVAQQHYIARAYAKSNFNKIQYSKDTSFYTKTDVPTVLTNEVTNVQNGSADVKGTIIDEGMSPVTEAGICWSSTNEMPTIANDSIMPLPIGAGGVMSGKLTNLKGGVTYYVRAFATNSNGTSYSDVVRQFSTPSIFKTLEQFPGTMRWPGSTAYFAIDGVLYLLGGDLGADYTNELWAYTIGSSDPWQRRQAFNGGPAKWQSGIPYGTGAYVYGGVEYDENKHEKPKPGLYYYNANINSWEERGPGADTLYQTVGCAYSNIVLYVGGKRDTVKRDVWVFEAPLKSWSKKTDFPVPQYGGVAVLLNSVIYAGMGRDDQDVCNGNLWVTTDGATTWTLKTSCDIYSGSILAGVAYVSNQHQRIYVIDEAWYILEYNPAEDVWTKKSRLPFGNIHCMYYYNDKIYIGLGDAANTLIVYDPLWDN
jgi:hypothetical protein